MSLESLPRKLALVFTSVRCTGSGTVHMSSSSGYQLHIQLVVVCMWLCTCICAKLNIYGQSCPAGVHIREAHASSELHTSSSHSVRGHARYRERVMENSALQMGSRAPAPQAGQRSAPFMRVHGCGTACSLLQHACYVLS